jgi:Domain of unknown function (DUF4160)
MPALSMFYGIVIRMYYFDNKQHNVPHIHAEYGEVQAVFEIATGELITGDFPKNKLKLVQAWMEIHHEDLMADWKLAVQGQEVFKIDPLK